MVERISKSEQKRLYKQVEQLAKELTDLSTNDIKLLPASSEIKENIFSCSGLKAGALKRQIKYLAKLLRQDDIEEIYVFMKAKKGSDLKERQLFHSAERWRDVLINEAMERHQQCLRDQHMFEPDYHSDHIDDVVLELPVLDPLEIRRVAYQYAKTRNRQHYRELFRMIKAAIEKKERAVDRK